MLSSRSEAAATFARVSDAAPPPSRPTASYRHVNVTPTVPQEALLSCLHKPSFAAWFQRCFRVSHLFGVPSPRKSDSTNRTHIPGISRALTKVQVSLCVDGGSDVLLGPFDACDSCGPTVFSACGRSIAQSRQCGTACSKQIVMNRVDLVQPGGHVTNPADQYTVVRDRGGRARHVRQDRLATVSDRTKWRAKLE